MRSTFYLVIGLEEGIGVTEGEGTIIDGLVVGLILGVTLGDIPKDSRGVGEELARGVGEILGVGVGLTLGVGDVLGVELGLTLGVGVAAGDGVTEG